MAVAQTNLQLYNQLRETGSTLDDLIVVHRAYELATELYAGHFQADGKPFVAHAVGVASILAQLDQPADIVATGVLHNVYGNADFGDGRGRGTTPSRRRLVRAAMGDRIEELLVRFQDLRLRPDSIEEARGALADRSEIERRLICVDLADHLEKYVDLGVLYFGHNDWILRTTERIGDDLIVIASELGEPRLAEMLSAAFSAAEAQRVAVPVALRPTDRRQHLKLIVPRSCRRRASVRLRSAVRGVRSRMRLRTRVRGSLRRPPRRSAA